MRRLVILAACSMLFGCGSDSGEAGTEEVSGSELAANEEGAGEEGSGEESSGEEGSGEESSGEEGSGEESSGEEGSGEESSGEEGTGEESSGEGEPTGGETAGPVEDCSNGTDDDLDGLVDCGDPECYTAANCDTGGEESTEGAEGEPPVEQVAFGAACGLSELCQPSITNEAGETVDNEEWPSCLNDQCDTGLCDMPACSKGCETDTDCEGAEDGPFGADNWSCEVVYLTLTGKEVKRCLPGTDFKSCSSSTECADGEICRIDLLNDEYGQYCMTAVKDGVGVGEECNINPTSGDVVRCANSMCSGTYCLGICADNSDCGSNPLFECQEDYYYSDLDQTFELCNPRACELESDCAELDGTYCRVLLANDNEVVQGEKYWSNSCWPTEEGDLAPGEACSYDAGAADCQNSFLCFNNVCSAPCDSDADCTGENERCEVREFNVDGFSYNFPLKLCITSLGSREACTAESDCPEGEYCSSSILETGAFEYTIEGQCEIAYVEGAAAPGEACGDDIECANGLCFGGTSGPNYCSGHCNTASDCGQFVDEEGQILTGLCNSYSWGTVGTTTDLDDLYLPLCIYTEGSGQACTPDSDVCGETEACTPLVITSLPTDVPVIEWSCLELGESADNGIGEECEGDSDCASGLCVLPKWGSNPGYCSAYCTSSDMCPETSEEEGADVWACVDWALIEREDESTSAIVQRCEK